MSLFRLIVALCMGGTEAGKRARKIFDDRAKAIEVLEKNYAKPLVGLSFHNHTLFRDYILSPDRFIID